MNKSVRIVLVGTSHAGNIGASARAMKNMGFSELYLVRPCKFKTYEAYARASGADEIIDNATVCDDLGQALTGCTQVFGTSARSRTMQWEDCDIRQAASSLTRLSQTDKVAFVFGSERSGLSNSELELCHHRVRIPTNPGFSSLNLAAAVQLVTYELSISLGQCDADSTDARTDECTKEAPAPAEDMQQFYRHLESTLIDLKFLDPDNPRLLMRRLRRLFLRSKPTRAELNILRGILAAIGKRSG